MMAARRLPSGEAQEENHVFGKKNFTVLAEALALSGSAQAVGAGIHLQRIGEDRKVSADGSPFQRFAFRKHEQFRGSFVRGEHNPTRIHGHDRGGAAFDENVQLFLHFTPQLLFVPDIGEEFESGGTAPDEPRHKQARARVGDDRERETEKAFSTGTGMSNHARRIEQSTASAIICGGLRTVAAITTGST